MKKGIYLVLLSAIVVFILSEIFLSFWKGYPFSSPEKVRSQSVEFEPAPFSKKRITRLKRDILTNWNTVLKINSYGYRGAEIDPVKQKFRIVVYGGSGVFDPIVKLSWPEKLQNLFAEKSANIEVINAGIPGDSSAEIMGRFFSEVRELKPDLVLIYETWNDVQFFNPEKEDLNKLPVFNEMNNPYLYPRNAVDEFLAENSKIYLSLRYGFLDKYGPILNPQFFSDKKKYTGFDGDFKDEIKSEFANQVYINYQTIAQVAKLHKVKTVFLTQALLISPNNTEAEKKKITYGFVKLKHKAVSEAIDLISLAIVKSAKDSKVSLLDARSEFPRDIENFYDQVHLSEKGSQMMVDYVYNQLTQKKLVPLK
jgi:lysophospholipase L1-like esterase